MTTEQARRPELPAGAGINSRELDLAVTREELARTLDDLFAKFNLRLIITSRPVIFGAVFLVGAIASAVAVAASIRRGRGRG